jgi:acetolactate synthase-1/2/3 large subunit
MTSGGLGTMGYGFPASIGVQMAHPEALVINVAGEASWLMNMQEMGTAVQYRLPVKQFILNNERLGMVRQWQELLHGERYSHSGPRRCPISSSWPRPSAPRASCARTPPIWTTRSWRCWTMTGR